ncbi:MAG: hypothetical protein A2355_02580 [Spirochaetes bacterium RIFOXYB1_FULL_32_8]|nr:MAG: hypothetical protein A2Y29_01515 [Spirochaetes bacterium GWE2_31_10]OHD74108.1 MAG: hypothetical protein A2355_02580 [Spirochaetes bacterium RIFOXYB1_FULL_32_8]HBD94633.1 hypothetical protein [Spirochaetia bacterium]HBI39251.1 hypothetical protein [Spirochaetia bacterium]
MSTRGAWGFFRNGESATKITYNHMDSYPEFLGQNVVDFIRNSSIDELNTIFDKIILVDNSEKPTEEQIDECKSFANTDVSTGSLYDWYCLLRNTQGQPELYKENLRYMLDSGKFLKDSLFCEWAYIINLNTNELEIYRGFRKKPNKKSNRYKILNSENGYYSCEILYTYPLDKIPDNWLDELIVLLNN